MHDRQYVVFWGIVLCCLSSVFSPSQASLAQEERGSDSELISTFLGPNQVEPVLFSQPRGFYAHAFYLILTTNTENATVYYTTDGSIPTPETASIALDHNQAFPLIINKTTCVRAVAVNEEAIPSKICTQTYLFTRDAIGLPSGTDQALVEAGLLALPSVMLATEPVPAGANESSWASVEWLMPDVTEGFQVDATLSQRLDTTVRQSSGKTSFHVSFDEPLLGYPLFDTLRQTSHAGFDLYACTEDSWAGSAGSYASLIRDVFSHDLQSQTGQPSLQNRFCHVYINGQYQGLYQMQEQVSAAARRTNPDAQIQDLDILQTDSEQNTITAIQGTSDALNRLYAQAEIGFGDMTQYYRVQGMNVDGQKHPQYERLLDVDNLIDFMIIEYFTGDTNGPGSRLNQGKPNHVLAVYNREAPDGFKWLHYNNVWSLGMGHIDAALASQSNMVKPLASGTASDIGSFSCHTLHEQLMASNADYRMHFADRVYEHFFNAGIMTENQTRALVQTRANQVQEAIIAEAAHWGKDTQLRNAWLDEMFRLKYGTRDHQGQVDERLLTGRTQTVLAQLKTNAWYPDITVPEMSLPSSLVLPGSTITLMAPEGITYVTLDGTDPRASGGSVNGSAQIYAGPITVSGTTQIKARSYIGGTWSALCQGTFVTQDATKNLRISEMMPNPLEASTSYIELKNIGSVPIDLYQIRLGNAVDFTFPAISLAPESFVLVVEDKPGFEAKYGTDLPVAGQYSGRLGRQSERLTLHDPIDQVIHDFVYETAWYDLACGEGFSLMVRPESLVSPHEYGDATSWRPSQTEGGSPGTEEMIQNPLQESILINEILSHSHDAASDWIELYNTSDDCIHIGGWFLSDDLEKPQKYEISYGTTIEPHDYLVLFEVEHFGNPFDPGAREPFALSENGEALIISSGLDGALTGLQIDESFGPSNTGIPFGRYQKSTEAVNFVFMSEPTPGQVNAAPLVGPVVISEIMYHPSNDDDAEYVELTNISQDRVILFDPVEYLPWRFQDNQDGSGISLGFPLNPGLELEPNERLLLVKDKAAFYGSYYVPDRVTVLEWPSGKLSNSGEKIQLDQPGDVDMAGQRYWIRVDRVNYSDGSHPNNSGIDLWPAGPDGRGWALQRIDLDEYGNDPINWRAGMATPGW